MNMLVARNFIPALKFGAKILLSDMANGGILTIGNVWWVDSVNGADTNDGKTNTSAFLTVAAAYAAASSNNDDYILLSGNNVSNKVTSMLTVSKNRIHFVGLGGDGRILGSRTLISNTGAGAATDIAMVQVTGTGNTFHNIKFSNNWTTANNLSAMLDNGANSFFENCDFEALGSAHLTNNAAASVICAGDESVYRNCTIGERNLLGTSSNGQELLIAAQTAGRTLGASQCLFDHCLFQAWSSDTGHAFVRAAASSINSDTITFNDCVFANRSTYGGGGVAFSVAVVLTASSGGSLNFAYPRIFGAAKLSTSTGVFTVSPVTAASTTLVGVQAS